MRQLIIRHYDQKLSVTGNFGYQYVTELESNIGNKVKLNKMFSKVNKAYIELNLFFLPELYAITKHILKRRRVMTSINKPALEELLEYIEKEIWKISDSDDKSDPYDYSIIDRKFNVKMLPHQDQAIRTYKKISSENGYRGMVLYGDVGTGKSLCGLMLAELLLSEKIILVVPLQTIHKVWVSTIEDRYKVKQDYYIVGDKNKYTNQRIIISSYENLPKLLDTTELLSGNARTSIIVDESHNFADHKSNRTSYLLKLINKVDSDNNILMSGTPIKSGFKELAIILSMLDRRFKGPVIDAFITLYKSPTKTMTEILQSRFASHTARMEKKALKLDPVITEYIPIKLKNGDDYTLASIKKVLKEYVLERISYYNKNRGTYLQTYKNLYEKAKKLLKNKVSESEFKEYEVEFNMVVRYFENGSLMKYPDLIKRVNTFEDKVISPVLNGEEKTQFRESKTIIKYAVLKVQGEALANVVMRKRIEAHRDMAAELNYNEILTSTKKKTIIFSNYTEVCDAALQKTTKLKFKPITVYGNTTKDLNQNVGAFINKKDVNPLITTFKSLSTGVPLVAANVIVVLDLPFRMYVYEQAIARAWRLGQDSQVYVYIPKLDTGEFPNINSRNIDIIQFFKQEVEAITGEKMTVSLDPSIAPSTEEFCNLYFGNISIEHLEPTNTMGVFERW